MKKWLSILVLCTLILSALLSLNEYLLTKAGHLHTIVSDADLWALERDKIDELGDQDILLLGASRMQVDIDLEEMRKEFPERKIIQLALAGLGSSLPVLKDIVATTKFNGIVLVDETQATMESIESQQDEIVRHYHQSFTFNRKLNKRISILLQQHFLFMNPNSSSARLWGNLASKRQLPTPLFTMTYPTREQTSYFDLTDTKWIYNLRMDGVKKGLAGTPENQEEWLGRAMQWRLLIDQFQTRGGKIIFVHMPHSSERWRLENEWMPKEKYWDKAISELHVPSIHFADYQQLQNFKIPDTSHLDSESKKEFTKNLSAILKSIIDPQ